MHQPIPVTLLTGFLGAGKTTLLNRLLHDPTAGRVAVIVNEFGEAGLDHDLIEESAEDVVLMTAGCLCCSIRGNLSKTLLSLLARRVKGELAFDRVVIETSGLSDPGPIHQTLLSDRVFLRNFVLDGIVTVVDAVLGAATLDRHLEAQSQVAVADRIVLTKCDLAAAQSRDALNSRLDSLNPGAPRIISERGLVPPGALFGLGALRRPMEPDRALKWLTIPDPDPLAGLSNLSFSKQPPQTSIGRQLSHHSMDSRIATASIRLDTPVPASVFDSWLEVLASFPGSRILRTKGIVHIEGSPKPFVFHGVQHVFEPRTPLEEWPDDDTESRIVIIARDVPEPELERLLEALRVPSRMMT